MQTMNSNRMITNIPQIVKVISKNQTSPPTAVPPNEALATLELQNYCVLQYTVEMCVAYDVLFHIKMKSYWVTDRGSNYMASTR